jgi:hypothetical protein
MSAEYRTLEPLPFHSLNRLENHGISVEMGAGYAELIGPHGVLCARPEGDSTHFERSLCVDTQAILEAIEKECGVTILDEDDPRFWGFKDHNDMVRAMNEPRRRALIEGPSTRDIDFATAWLNAAVGARESLCECSKERRFRWSLDYLQIGSCIEFHSSAMDFVGGWLHGKGAFEFEVSRDYVRGVTFTVMNALGFFTLTGQRYQMTIPANVTHEEIRKAVHRLTEIHDGNGCFYPEDLAVSIEPQEAEEWAIRLRGMKEDERLADRNALLDR